MHCSVRRISDVPGVLFPWGKQRIEVLLCDLSIGNLSTMRQMAAVRIGLRCYKKKKKKGYSQNVKTAVFPDPHCTLELRSQSDTDRARAAATTESPTTATGSVSEGWWVMCHLHWGTGHCKVSLKWTSGEHDQTEGTDNTMMWLNCFLRSKPWSGWGQSDRESRNCPLRT